MFSGTSGQPQHTVGVGDITIQTPLGTKVVTGVELTDHLLTSQKNKTLLSLGAVLENSSIVVAHKENVWYFERRDAASSDFDTSPKGGRPYSTSHEIMDTTSKSGGMPSFKIIKGGHVMAARLHQNDQPFDAAGQRVEYKRFHSGC